MDIVVLCRELSYIWNRMGPFFDKTTLVLYWLYLLSNCQKGPTIQVLFGRKFKTCHYYTDCLISVRWFWIHCATWFKICSHFQISTRPSEKVVANFKLYGTKHQKLYYWNKETSNIATRSATIKHWRWLLPCRCYLWGFYWVLNSSILVHPSQHKILLPVR